MHPLQLERENTMEFHLETIAPCPTAGLRRTGPYGAENAALMEALKDWARRSGLLREDSVLYGIAWDNPQFTRPEDCRYEVSLVLPEGASLPQGAVYPSRFPGGQYAVAVIPHTPEGVQLGWAELFPALQAQGLRLDETRPIVERYTALMVKTHRCELCAPVL